MTLSSLLRRFRVLWIVVAYLVCRELLAWLTVQRSLLTPGGTLDPLLAALTLLALVSRLASVFVVPAVVLVRAIDLVAPKQESG